MAVGPGWLEASTCLWSAQQESRLGAVLRVNLYLADVAKTPNMPKNWPKLPGEQIAESL
jgi:hypothetical protein